MMIRRFSFSTTAELIFVWGLAIFILSCLWLLSEKTLARDVTPSLSLPPTLQHAAAAFRSGTNTYVYETGQPPPPMRGN